MAIIVPSVIGAACFPMVFRKTGNKGLAAAFFAFLTGITMIGLYFFSPNGSAIMFYLFSALSWFFYNSQNEMLAFCKTKCSIRKTKRILLRVPSYTKL